MWLKKTCVSFRVIYRSTNVSIFIQISTCIAFAALTQKDTRNTAGLRVSGVGGCVCARHECMRPNGLGDLQKGER
jgi:Kyakuja-Dileera-Zisupton transposase